MKVEKWFKWTVAIGVIGIWTIVFQNLGVIPRLEGEEVDVGNTVRVRGEVDVSGSVDIPEPLEVDIDKINGWEAANYESYTHGGEEFHSLGCE